MRHFIATAVRRLARVPGQLLGTSPFGGTIQPTRIPVLRWKSRPALPFPHPWNYNRPLDILESYFADAESEAGPGRHSRYLDVPGLEPVLVTRDPRLIRAIAAETGDKPGQFDRDPMPSVGIARATGRDTLLFSNGPFWKRQKLLAAPPFGKTTLFQPEQFHEFAETFRHTVRQRLAALDARVAASPGPVRIRLEPEIKAVMLEMLVNNFFGAEVEYSEIRERYVPALERVIDHIVRDTVMNKFGVPITKWPRFTKGIARAQEDLATFERLTDVALAARHAGRGLWKQFKSDAPNEKLRANLKVFLAGALEATTSFASWAVVHLARHPVHQEKVFQDVAGIEDYTPETLEGAKHLRLCLEETLRLTPSLYFLPRRATAASRVTTSDGRTLDIPAGTHILLDVWHANRHEDHWGSAVTGSPALDFVPERWDVLAARGQGSKEKLHFGFGHGPRVCPGKHLGQLEVALAVGAFVKLFRFRAVEPGYTPRAGVSTKPADGVLLELERRMP